MVYITLLITFLISYSNANNITFEGFGNADISGFSFNDNSSYKLYKSNGHWKSSTGDFGLHEGLGTVRIDKNNKNKPIMIIQTVEIHILNDILFFCFIVSLFNITSFDKLLFSSINIINL